MPTRRDPFSEVEQLIERMNRQLEAATGSRSGEEFADEEEYAPVDLVEYDDEFVATVDLPGFDRSEVSVEVTDNTLRIAGEREEETEEREEGEEERVLRRERRHESVQRSLSLPDEIDTDGVTAEMKNGVLTVTLPRLDVESSREIEIE
ncbi:Hsp20/alpha crystallin family protein [Halobaculum roseum]|uniref:Hsp20/alpha crystallin family protein n=1 Tax=Halobaculum roseum TaxID=2175149 RepID=A0ABD5MY96_9EURY|nr:Hsp20/alpha crystallin family protein [Halobaculum roseum]QZY04672.1 Hsp20/alpha crystallin family protein [Halobaculum roseum]